MIEKAFRLLGTVNSKVGKLASFLILLLNITVLYEVIARYVFNAPTAWNFKLTSFLYGGACILAGAWVLYENRHVSIDLISMRLSPKARAIVNIVTYLFLFFPFVGIILWKGIDQAVWSWQMNQHDFETPWGPPVYPIKTVIPVAVFLLLLQGIAIWIRDLLFLIKEKKQ